MPTANERKALWFLALVALSGSGVRLWRARSPLPTPADASALARQIQRVDSVRAATERRKSGRPRRAPDTTKRTDAPAVLVDLDRATAADIESLPGIGPALAQRIVAHRDSAGPFGGLDAMCDVRGIGPALAQRLRPLVTFSGPPRPLSVACSDASKRAPKRETRGTPKPR